MSHYHLSEACSAICFNSKLNIIIIVIVFKTSLYYLLEDMKTITRL